VEVEVELAKAAKELEEEMEAESDWTGGIDVTPRAWHDLFGELKEEAEPDEKSEDPWEKEWVASHKDLKNAEVHLATAWDNLMVAMYTHGYAPGEAADQQLVDH
jgi:hypothetical protein